MGGLRLALTNECLSVKMNHINCKYMSKEITNDELAMIVKEGFESLENRMDKFEGRMDKVEVKLDKVEERLSGLENKVDAMDLRLSHMAPAFEIEELKNRMVLVERKIGLRS